MSEITAFLATALLGAACHGTISDDAVPPGGSGATQGAGGSAGSTSGSAGAGNAARGGGGGSSNGGSKSTGGTSGSSGKGTAGGGGDSGSSGTGSSTDPALFGACPDGDPAAGVTPLSKLSTVQYRNTVQDLLTASGLGDVVAEVSARLASVPDDSTQASFRGLDKRISGAHIQTYFDVAVAVGDAATKSSARLTALAGSCATQSSLSSSCLDAFLNSFGRRALRRPLTDAELTEYRDVATGDAPKAANAAEALRNVVVSLLMSPRFVNHLELEGSEVSGQKDYLALDPYEVASRLSYTFWQTLPDDALFAAAEDGSLDTDAGFDAALTRIFADPRTQQTIWQFWNEWLRFEAFTGFSAERPAFQSLAEGEHLGESGHDHWKDMVTEIKDLTDLYTWKQPGSLLDLMTSTVSVTRSNDLAHLYGVKAWSGSGEYPALPDGTRQGLLQRSALLVSSLETTNPFHRGATIRRAILCEDLQPPDPNSLPKGSLDPPPIDATLTTRERFQKKVEGIALCAGCHGTFSNIGYTLEAFDSLGRFRTEEKVFDEQTGDLRATLPLDTVASVQIGDEPESDVSGPVELNQRIIASGKLEGCLSANYFRYALRRDPTSNSADACAFEKMRTGLDAPGKGLADVFRVIASEPEFRRRKVGAP
jgi:hypothetical protein